MPLNLSTIFLLWLLFIRIFPNSDKEWYYLMIHFFTVIELSIYATSFNICVLTFSIMILRLFLLTTEKLNVGILKTVKVTNLAHVPSRGGRQTFFSMSCQTQFAHANTHTHTHSHSHTHTHTNKYTQLYSAAFWNTLTHLNTP